MGVFEDLRDAFREAVANFKAELNRETVPETVDDLLLAMREEVVDAQSSVRRLEDEIRSALERAAAEEEEAATCRRRERLAGEIGDEDTARIAREFAEKHERRQRVLERKALALEDELKLRRSEAREMLERLKEARSKRDGLAARTGRVQARDSIRDADELFAELDRMAERVEDAGRRVRASEELREELEVDLESGRGGRRLDEAAEARLKELKRRMEEDGDLS